MPANRQWQEQTGVEPARHELAPTAERIIKAARRILVKKGYPSLTMQEVEKESGVNRALVHYYFGSKAGLVEALVETLFEDPAFGYSDAVVQAPEGEQRRQALLAWLRRIVRDRRSGRMLYELLPHFLRSRRLRTHVAGLYSAYRDFDGQLPRGRSRGRRPGRPRAPRRPQRGGGRGSRDPAGRRPATGSTKRVPTRCGRRWWPCIWPRRRARRAVRRRALSEAPRQRRSRHMTQGAAGTARSLARLRRASRPALRDRPGLLAPRSCADCSIWPSR